METALFLPIISVLFLVVGVALLFLGFAYHQLAGHFERLHHQASQKQAGALQQADKIIDSAREESHQMLEKSEEKAQEIVINAEFFTAASQKELGEKLETATRSHLAEYKKMLATFRTELSTTLNTMSKDLEAGAGQELDLFRQHIQEQTQQAENEFNQQVSKNFQLAEAEVAAYKQTMIKKIDQQASEIVKEVINEVVPKIITPKEHEQLVLDALTQAKQTHAI